MTPDGAIIHKYDPPSEAGCRWMSSDDTDLNLFLNFNNDNLWRITFQYNESTAKTLAIVELNLRR